MYMVLVCVGRSIEITECTGTSNFYSTVLSSEHNATVLYIYKVGCRFCQQLDPKLQYITDVFADENLSIVKVNGKVASNLIKDLQVRSFPQLFVFQPVPSQMLGGAMDNRTLVHEHSSVSQYHGKRTIPKIADWISESTGILPHWPGSRVVDDIDSMTKFNETLPPNVVAAIFEREQAYVERPVCLAFVTSWMDIQYTDMFTGDLDTSILETASSTWPQIDFYKLDSSSAALSHLTSQLQISGSPALCFIYGNKILKVAFMPYDDNSRNRELDYVNDIIVNCVVSDSGESCSEYVSSLPLVDFYTFESGQAPQDPDSFHGIIGAIQDGDDSEEEYIFDAYDF